MEREKQIFALMRDVLELHDKFEKTRNGSVRDSLRKKRAILDNMLKQELDPRDQQQVLFEAK